MMKYQKMLKMLFGLVLFSSVTAQAQEEHWYNFDHLYFQAGTYVHFSSSEDHDGPNILVSLEAVRSDDWLYGLSLFDNSFGQFSQYLYGGKNWDFSGNWENFHAKLTVGLIHGYKGEWEDKIPYNDLGIAPGIVPSIGYKKGRFGVDMILLGNSAMLFTLGMDF